MTLARMFAVVALALTVVACGGANEEEVDREIETFDHVEQSLLKDGTGPNCSACPAQPENHPGSAYVCTLTEDLCTDTAHICSYSCTLRRNKSGYVFSR